MSNETDNTPDDDGPPPAHAHVLLRTGDGVEPHTLFAETFRDSIGEWVRLAPAEAGGPIITLDLVGMQRFLAACADEPWAA